MSARIPITIYAREGEGQASFELLVKSDQDIAKIDFAIESGANRSSVQFRFDSDGKSELVIDANSLETLTQKIVMETARIVLEAGIMAVHGNECDIKTDTVLNLLSQAKVNLSAPDVQIGAGALSLTSTAQATINAANLLISIIGAGILKAPEIWMQGLVKLGQGDMRPIARVGDQVQVFGVEAGGGTAIGTIISGGSNLSS